MPTQAEVQAKYETKFRELQQEAEKTAEELKREGEKLGDDAGAKFKVDFTVRWVDRRIVMNLPQVTMRTQSVKFDLPETRTELREIIFHTPSVRMKLVKVGQYPEIHGFTVVWKDILVEVPEPFMQEQRIKLDIPEVRMTTREIKLDLPDFSWAPTEFVITLPEIEVKDISFVVPIESDDVKARSEELQRRGEEVGAGFNRRATELAAAMKAEIMSAALEPARALAESAATAVAAENASADQAFMTAVAQVDTILRDHAAQLPGEQVAALQAARADVVSKREEAAQAMASFGEALNQEREELDVLEVAA